MVFLNKNKNNNKKQYSDNNSISTATDSFSKVKNIIKNNMKRKETEEDEY